MGRPTVCLSMIVRDEARVVTETLDRVAPHIDRWVVVDTGSGDATPDLVRSFFAARGIPGELHERPWRDFGTNRTEALELCRGQADYAWMIDADDLVHGALDLSRLSADSYLLRYGEDFRYWRKQIFRTSLPWKYEGAVHEYATCAEPASEARLEGDYHVESRRLGARSRAADKYERDSALLLEALGRDPGDARSVFYLAQSYFDAGDARRALQWYSRRAAMGGWGEEVCYSLLRKAACLERLDEPWEQILATYLEAWQARPTRAEPLYHLARLHSERGEHHAAYLFAKHASELPFPEDDTLFVAADVYRWRVTDQRSIAAYYTGRYRESFELCSALLESDRVPEPERNRVMANRDFSVEHVKDDALAYPEALVDRLARRKMRSRPRVTLTITSCKRLELFERTVNSFLNCCEDVERIGRFVCIDDGSSAADRRRMSERYPFFELVFKDRRRKGHASSLNMLLETVESPYWLHLEDDWQFFVPAPYVERGLAVLRDDDRIGQVLFNRNYGQTLECREIRGGLVRRTARDGMRYRLHEHGTSALEGRSNGWWPHFSLRPSLMRTSVMRKLGAFRPDADHFELEFAARFAAAGHVSAFLDAIHCLHIGKLTWEDAAERPNAYALNGEPQFSRPVPRARARPRARRPPPPLAELAPSLELGEIRLDGAPPGPRGPRAAPSIAACDDGFRLIVHGCLASLDRDLALETVEPLQGDVAGYEDWRLVRVDGDWLATARAGREPFGPVLLRLDGATVAGAVAVPEGVRRGSRHGLLPFAADGRLHVLSSWAPTVVGCWDPAGGEHARVSARPGPHVAAGFSGGSQGIAVGEGLLFVVGEPPVHRLALLDEKFRLAALSRSFTIAGEDEERCAGLAAEDGRLVLSFGIGDRLAGLAVLPAAEALTLLEPIAA